MIHERLFAGANNQSSTRARLLHWAIRAGLVFCAVTFILRPALLMAQQAEPQPDAEQDAASPPPMAQPISQDQTSSVSLPTVTLHGMVRNSVTGEPLAKTLVRIEDDAERSTLTDSQGRFEIAGQPVGLQEVQVFKPGFRGLAASDSQGAGIQQEAAYTVQVASEMQDVAFTLTPVNSIHGQVELSTGDPAIHVHVILLRKSVRHGRALWHGWKDIFTNSDGSYYFGNLPDGVYAVYTSPLLESFPLWVPVEPDSKRPVDHNGYPAVYAPNARDLASASLIRLTAGEDAQANISLTLEPFHVVTATLVAPNGRQLTTKDDSNSVNPTFPAPLLLDADGHLLPYTAQYDDNTHTVQAELPDGSYNLAIVFRAEEAIKPGVDPEYQHPHYFVGSAAISVAGHAVSNVQIALFFPHSVPLHIRTLPNAGSDASSKLDSDSRPPLNVSLTYDSTSNIDEGTDSIAASDGADTFDLMSAPPYSYWVHTQIYDRKQCAGGFSGSGSNLGKEPLQLSLTGSATPMELTLRHDCAQLTLNLPALALANQPGIVLKYTVYIVPDFDSTEDVRPQTIDPSSRSSQTVEGLTPGNYHVYTFTMPVELEYKNPDVLGQLHGQPVTLAPNATASLVLEVAEHE
jgi:hypothetical protein